MPVVLLPRFALPAFLAAHPEHVGFSLTMPLKHALLRLAAEHDWEIDPEAARTGAGNTLVRHADGTRRVLNTDVAGIVRALSDAGVAPAAPGTRTAAVLGGGATAASATAGWPTSADSTSEVEIRWPDTFITSSTRPRTHSAPSESHLAPSPAK